MSISQLKKDMHDGGGIDGISGPLSRLEAYLLRSTDRVFVQTVSESADNLQDAHFSRRRE
jgi:hypothetical protein